MKYLFPFLICALFASCFNEGDCLVTATNNLRIQFKKKRSPTEDTTISFSYNSIELAGQGFLRRFAASQILLPVNIVQDSSATTFIIHRINSDSSKHATDTLKIRYGKQTKVISKDCGAYTFYQNLKVERMSSHHDSVEIKTISTSLLKNPTGSPSDFTSYAVNLQIFY